MSTLSPMKRPRKSQGKQANSYCFNSTAPMGSLNLDQSDSVPSLVHSNSFELPRHGSSEEEIGNDAYALLNNIMEDFAVPSSQVSQSEMDWVNQDGSLSTPRSYSGDILAQHNLMSRSYSLSDGSHASDSNSMLDQHTDKLAYFNIEDEGANAESSTVNALKVRGDEGSTNFQELVQTLNFEKVWDAAVPHDSNFNFTTSDEGTIGTEYQTKRYICEPKRIIETYQQAPATQTTNKSSQYAVREVGNSRILAQLRKAKGNLDSDNPDGIGDISNFRCSSLLPLGTIIINSLQKTKLSKGMTMSRDQERNICGPIVPLCHPLLSESGLFTVGTEQPLVSHKIRAQAADITGQKRRAKSLLKAFQRKVSVTQDDNGSSQKSNGSLNTNYYDELTEEHSTILVGRMRGTVGDDLMVESHTTIPVDSFVRDMKWLVKDQVMVYATNNLGAISYSETLDTKHTLFERPRRENKSKHSRGIMLGRSRETPRRSSADDYIRQIATEPFNNRIAVASHSSGVSIYSVRHGSSTLDPCCTNACDAAKPGSFTGSVGWHFSDPLLVSWTSDDEKFSMFDLRSSEVVSTYDASNRLVRTSGNFAASSTQSCKRAIDLTPRLQELASMEPDTIPNRTNSDIELANVSSSTAPNYSATKFQRGLYSHMFLTDCTVLLGFGDGHVQVVDVRKMRSIISHIDPVLSAVGEIAISPSRKRLALFGIRGTSIWEMEKPGFPVSWGYDYLLPRVPQCYPGFAYKTSGSFVTDELVGSVDSIGNLALYELSKLPDHAM